MQSSVFQSLRWKGPFYELRKVVGSKNLPLHDIQNIAPNGRLLGVQINGERGLAMPSLSRLWNVREAVFPSGRDVRGLREKKYYT